MAHTLEHELQEQVESTTGQLGSGHYSGRGNWLNWATEQDPTSGYDAAVSSIKEQRKKDYGGVFQLYGQEDMFTKITKGMRDATDKDTYKPFFETKRQTTEDVTLNMMNQAGYTKGGQARGFADSSARGSLMDDIMSGYGTKVVDYIGEMESSAAAGQRRLEEIIRNNQAQSQYLQELERG